MIANLPLLLLVLGVSWKRGGKMETFMIALIQSDYDSDYFHVSQMIAKIQLNDCSDDNSGDVHSSDYDCQ